MFHTVKFHLVIQTNSLLISKYCDKKSYYLIALKSPFPLNDTLILKSLCRIILTIKIHKFYCEAVVVVVVASNILSFMQTLVQLNVIFSIYSNAIISEIINCIETHDCDSSDPIIIIKKLSSSQQVISIGPSFVWE